MSEPARVHVRVATPEEYERVADLVELGFRTGPYGHLPVSAERTALVRDSAGRAKAGALLVAVEEDRLLGTASLLGAGAPGTRLARAGEVELRLIAVHPDARGRGIGDTLVRMSLTAAVGLGADAVVLDTGSLNLPAQRLYERVGFQRQHDRIPHGRGGPGSPDDIPALVYRYVLGAGQQSTGQ
jgi:ribosomal protein S18 acetylase RimI-like enzyme